MKTIMQVFRQFFYALLKWPVTFLTRSKVIPDNVQDKLAINDKKPIFYVVKHQSASDILTLQKVCKTLNLPDPLGKEILHGEAFTRILCLTKRDSFVSGFSSNETCALQQGQALLQQHLAHQELDAQLIPVNLTWGRAPAKEKNNANVGTLLADQESPTWWRKFFIVLFLGRHSLVRFSKPVSLRYMADNHGATEQTAQKLLRVARFHFYRQTIAATGPRLMHRQQMFTALLANPAVKKIIQDEAEAKKQPIEKIKQDALKIMDEIAGDFRPATIRFGERILSWLFKRLYQKIEVHHAEKLREVAQNGHEIVYVPCHRSHMDYLLLTYIIHQQGLVTPRIAAGINLNFWPAGPIFRKAGAFFIRRSFNGNRLYSTIFREYLGLLFERGYAVKYYTEGGRSRTGKLLQPKTGMLAMTIQSLLRGIDRPISLIPVYLGYEHVMEVATYHKELSGSKKQKESIAGVIKAIRNLRNYGMGYVNFGEPILLNQFLSDFAPDWKQAINPIEPQKPSWLTPSVNALSQTVMTEINKNAALNAVALAALCLIASEHQAMTKHELAAQIDFLLMLQRYTPYSDHITLPEQSGMELVEHLIDLNKVTVTQNNYGDIISLNGQQQLEMRYYRNNILHTFIVAALTCRLLDKHLRIAKDELINQVTSLTLLMKNELFLWQDQNEITAQICQLIEALASADKIKVTKAGYINLSEDTLVRSKIRLLGLTVEENLQRIAIITNVIKQQAPLNKTTLEQNTVAIAERLQLVNNATAPEFTDKKAQSLLINSLKEHGFIEHDEQNKLIACDKLEQLHQTIQQLIKIELMQSLNLSSDS